MPMRDEDPVTGHPMLIIGYGNTLRSDDSAGIRVAEAVAAQGLPGVRAMAVHQLTPELAGRLADVEVVVFVDARVAGKEAGLAISPVEPSSSMLPNGHLCDPRSLLALARWLYGHSPRAWLLTVPGIDFSIGEKVSPTAATGIDRAIERIAELIERGRLGDGVRTEAPLRPALGMARR
jgi:hydrogenase maturation protease